MVSDASPATTADREVLSGVVERVTFHNPDNGSCVLRVTVRGQRELVTIVGHAASITAGEYLQAAGSWVNDRTHGLQFKAAFLHAAAPTMAEGIEKYLASGRIKGIGSVSAKKLVHPAHSSAFPSLRRMSAPCVTRADSRQLRQAESAKYPFYSVIQSSKSILR